MTALIPIWAAAPLFAIGVVVLVVWGGTAGLAHAGICRDCKRLIQHCSCRNGGGE